MEQELTALDGTSLGLGQADQDARIHIGVALVLGPSPGDHVCLTEGIEAELPELKAVTA